MVDNYSVLQNHNPSTTITHTYYPIEKNNLEYTKLSAGTKKCQGSTVLQINKQAKHCTDLPKFKEHLRNNEVVISQGPTLNAL